MVSVLFASEVVTRRFSYVSPLTFALMEISVVFSETRERLKTEFVYLREKQRYEVLRK